MASALLLAAHTTRNLQKLHTDSTRHSGFSTIYLHGGCKADAPNHRHVPVLYPTCTLFVISMYPSYTRRVHRMSPSCNRFVHLPVPMRVCGRFLATTAAPLYVPLRRLELRPEFREELPGVMGGRRHRTAGGGVWARLAASVRFSSCPLVAGVGSV